MRVPLIGANTARLNGSNSEAVIEAEWNGVWEIECGAISSDKNAYWWGARTNDSVLGWVAWYESCDKNSERDIKFGGIRAMMMEK